MRFLSVFLVFFITYWGYAPAGWAQRNHEDDTAEIVHFIFYSDEGAPSVAPEQIEEPNNEECDTTCQAPRQLNDDCECVCPYDEVAGTAYCQVQHGSMSYMDDNCVCQCPLVNHPEQCTGSTPNAHTENNTCFCGCDLNQAICAEQGLSFNENSCECNCSLDIATCAAEGRIFTANTCSCDPCSNNTCQGNIPQNNLGYNLQAIISNNACSCACVSNNQNLDWDNVNQQCFQNGCDLNQRFSTTDTAGIMDGCCNGQIPFDSNNNNTNDACCPANNLYDADNNGINDTCCPHDLINGICPCTDDGINTFIYVSDGQFFTGDEVTQANQSCSGCPSITANGVTYQLTEISSADNAQTGLGLAANQKSCTLWCHENHYSGVQSGMALNINNDFVCPCVTDRHFAPTNEPQTQTGSFGQYCECQTSYMRTEQTDDQGLYATCMACETYDDNPSLFEYVTNFFGIPIASITNKSTTYHCPTIGEPGFANQNSKAQTVGINGVACPPMAAMTNAGGVNTNPTCSYGDLEDDLRYCYTGTLTNTVGVDKNNGDTNSRTVNKFGPCSDLLGDNAELILSTLVEANKAIKILLNTGALYIVSQDTVKNVECQYDADYGFYDCTVNTPDIDTMRVMYYGLYSCPFGFENGQCRRRCHPTTMKTRTQNGTTYCVCKEGHVPDGTASDTGITIDGQVIREPQHCTSFGAFRVMTPTNDCKWKGCSVALTGHTSAGGRQDCNGEYQCSNNDTKTNTPGAATGITGTLGVCKDRSTNRCTDDYYPNTARLFAGCPPADGSTSSYFWDSEIWGGQLDQELMNDTTGGVIRLTNQAQYINDYYKRACSTVRSQLPLCTQGQFVYLSKEGTYVQDCECPGLTLDGLTNDEKANLKCCGFGQYYDNGACYACGAQSYLASPTNTTCTKCSTGFDRMALDLSYTGKEGETPCFQCPANAFPLSHTAGCYTCGDNQIPIYTSAATTADAATKYNNRCTSQSCDETAYHWECYTCPNGFVPNENAQNPDCVSCAGPKENLTTYKTCTSCGGTWNSNNKTCS